METAKIYIVYKNHAGMKAPAFMRGDEIPAFA